MLKSMLDHVTIRVADFKNSREFYDAALAPLGIARIYDDGPDAAGYGRDGTAFFWIAQHERPATRSHIAFKSESRAAVVEFHRVAIVNGGRDNGPPGERPHYGEQYFAAFVLDPDGNNIEAVVRCLA